MSNNESKKGEIVMYQPNETIRLEVRMGEDTVWLATANGRFVPTRSISNSQTHS